MVVAPCASNQDTIRNHAQEENHSGLRGADLNRLFGARGIDRAGLGCPARPSLEEADLPSGASEEEKSTIFGMLRRRVVCAPGSVRKSRAPVLAWAGLRLAAMVLLVAGVGVRLGDGDDDFDDAGCAVSRGAGAGCHHSRSGQARGDTDVKGKGGPGGPGGRPPGDGPPSLPLKGGPSPLIPLPSDGRGGSDAVVEMLAGIRKEIAEVRRWQEKGKEYQAMVDLVRWRKKVGRKEKLPLNEAIGNERAQSADYPALLSDVLDGLLSMTEENWAERCGELTDMLRVASEVK